MPLMAALTDLRQTLPGKWKTAETNLNVNTDTDTNSNTETDMANLSSGPR